MRWPSRPLWHPPLIAVALWFAVAVPLADRALQGLDLASRTRLMVLAIATIPVLGAVRGIVDARLARAAERKHARAAEAFSSESAPRGGAPEEDDESTRAAS